MARRHLARRIYTTDLRKHEAILCGASSRTLRKREEMAATGPEEDQVSQIHVASLVLFKDDNVEILRLPCGSRKACYLDGHSFDLDSDGIDVHILDYCKDDPDFVASAKEQFGD